MPSLFVHPSIDESHHTGENYHHEWRAPGPGDSRSPCPALNALANHGYLPRDGKNLSIWDLISAIKTGYSLSLPLAAFITIGAFALLRRFQNISLHELGYHGRVEHDASLVRDDALPGEAYAPNKVNTELLDDLIADTGLGHHMAGTKEIPTVMDAADLARARIRREKRSPPLDGVHAEIARGEMSIILGVFGTKSAGREGVPVQYIRDWFGEERMPVGWKPTHVEGLLSVVRRSKAFRAEMDAQKEEYTKP